MPRGSFPRNAFDGGEHHRMKDRAAPAHQSVVHLRSIEVPTRRQQDMRGIRSSGCRDTPATDGLYGTRTKIEIRRAEDEPRASESGKGGR